MKSKNLVGVITPVITTFNPNGEVDRSIAEELVDFLMQYVHALFICGTYGSGALMEADQRKKVAEIVAKKIDDKISLVVHMGSTNTKTAVNLAIFVSENSLVGLLFILY